MSATNEIEQAIRESGNVRDALNVALAQKKAAEKHVMVLEAALEASQRNYTEVVDLLQAVGKALGVRTLSEIVPAIEALK